MRQVILMNDDELLDAALSLDSLSKGIIDSLFDVGKLIPAEKGEEWCNIAAQIIDNCTSIQKISSDLYCTDYWYGDEESEMNDGVRSIEEGL